MLMTRPLKPLKGTPRAKLAFTPVEILIALVILGIMAITIGISLTVIT
jgi:type II secretory pathway pseudopilin PulG